LATANVLSVVDRDLAPSQLEMGLQLVDRPGQVKKNRQEFPFIVAARQHCPDCMTVVVPLN
jgi:hypothetical protein